MPLAQLEAGCCATVTRPRRILMTIDAVGGVWRYGVDLARAAGGAGHRMRAGRLRPRARCGTAAGMRGAPQCALRWTGCRSTGWRRMKPAFDDVGGTLLAIGRDIDADLLHLNLPSQAADPRRHAGGCRGAFLCRDVVGAR